MWPQVEKVEKEKQQKIQSIGGPWANGGRDTYSIVRNRNFKESVHLHIHAPKIWDKIQDLLDEKGYKVIRPREIPTGDL